MSTTLWGCSDLHVGHWQNRLVLQDLWPRQPEDWLIVAGDVAESISDIRWALRLLRQRFAKVIWTPGNHEMWSTAVDPPYLRGVRRYHYLVEMCRDLGVVTPEDTYPLWSGDGGPALLVPMFLLYDYSFLPAGAWTKAQGIALANARCGIPTDESLLSCEPYASLEQWCHARVRSTARRLCGIAPATPLVLINHFPLLRQPTRRLRVGELAMWCGTELTRDWHRSHQVLCVVYGHLHIRRRDRYDGVRFEEVSLGYAREWPRGNPPKHPLRQILPDPPAPAQRRAAAAR